jgi:2-methylaconitate cis-trans-isomerase PrpF
MLQKTLRAVFMRGGTSKALMFHQRDLPADRADWAPIFLGAIGAPDPNGRQLDGMGGGVSSLSKVCVIGPPSRHDADVDYTFAQVAVKDAAVDYSGNCGNMSSAVGPFALDEGLVGAGGNEACVRIHNTNTQKIIVSRFPIEEGRAAVDGDFVLPGVAGSGAPIRLEFTDPGGAGTGKLLPSGAATDVLEVPGLGSIEASLIDAANPCVFVAASALGATGTEMPDAIDADPGLLEKFEAIRRAASVRMGLAADLAAAAKITGIPKIAMVSAPHDARTLSREAVAADTMDIAARMISVGQPHRAMPLTGAMCLAVASRIDGSIPHRLARRPAKPGDDIRIAQPSGLTVVAASVRKNGQWIADHAVVYRTARRLMEGMVYYRAR